MQLAQRKHRFGLGISGARTLVLPLVIASALTGCIGDLQLEPGRAGDPGPAPSFPRDSAQPGEDAGIDAVPPVPPSGQHDAGPAGDDPDPVAPEPFPSIDAGSDPAPAPIDGGGAGCAYPESSGRLANGQTMPPYVFRSAYREDGAQIEFDLRDFQCGEAWGEYRSMLIVVGTGWCPNCPDYLREIAAMHLEREGTLVIWLESQNSSYESATSAEARTTVDAVIGAAPGLRIGDADNSRPDAIGSQTSSVPAGYFVRRRDMRILADENELGTTPDWRALAADPEGTGGGGSSGFGSADEERYEPNDTSASAAAIEAGTFDGGVCAAAPDWYRVAIAGRWRMDVAFSHAEGDIDVYVVDDAGGTIATSDSADDDESVTGTGPARVRVEGWRGANATYRLTLVSL